MKAKQSKAGRPKVEGRRHMYTVSDDVHAYIMSRGGGSFITDTFRAVLAFQRERQREKERLTKERG